jgi:hypothetical protein
MPIDFYKKYKKQLLDDYVDEKWFNAHHKQWVNKFGDGYQSQKDFIWSMFNRCINELGKRPQSYEVFNAQTAIYFIMLKFLWDEKKDVKGIRKSIAQVDVNRMVFDDAQSDLICDVVIISTKCCPECERIDGKVMTLDEVVKNPPLPQPECTRNNGCVCCYARQGRRDSNGRLVYRK